MLSDTKRLSIRTRDETGTQDGMAMYQITQRMLQHLNIQFTGQLQCNADGLGQCGTHLVQQPQALLQRRNGNVQAKRKGNRRRRGEAAVVLLRQLLFALQILHQLLFILLDQEDSDIVKTTVTGGSLDFPILDRYIDAPLN